MTMKCSSSSSLSILYVVMGLCLVWAVSADDTAVFDCGASPFNSFIPKFTSLSVFPNPVRVGQQIHIRTVVSLPDKIKKGDIKEGMLAMDLKFKDKEIDIVAIPLCNASSAIDCSTLGAGDNGISFDYWVPTIPTGTYTITFRIDPNITTTGLGQGCLFFDVQITDPDANPDKFVSWIEAELAGVSQFENPNYMDRYVQEYLQVGPVGDIDPNVAYIFPWGTFISLKGSGDIVQPNFATAGYVWGLSGEMTEITFQDATHDQVYSGEFHVGYVTSLAKRALDIEIITGRFTLTWHFHTNSDGVVSSTCDGTISFDEVAVLPLGFSNPVTVGRIPTVSVYTNGDGVLMLAGTANTCLGDAKCDVEATDQTNSGDDLSSWQIGLITAVIVGVALVFVLVIAVWKWHRRSKRHEEEDGIFAARRKPEYGNALVVDDIIQETREHSPNIMPPLHRRDAELTDSDSDDDYTRSRSRSRSASPYSYSDRSKSPPRNRSRSGSRSGSDSDDYTDAGSSASRA